MKEEKLNEEMNEGMAKSLGMTVEEFKKNIEQMVKKHAVEEKENIELEEEEDREIKWKICKAIEGVGYYGKVESHDKKINKSYLETGDPKIERTMVFTIRTLPLSIFDSVREK